MNGIGEGLIIDVPEQMTRERRAAETGLTALAALLWLVALRPVVLLGLWYLGSQVAYAHMVKLQGWDNRDSFLSLGTTAAGLCLLMLAWSRYNALRFRRRDRRTFQRSASDREIGAHFRLPEVAIAQLRVCRRVRVERPTRVELVVTVDGGLRWTGYHDPLGVPNRNGWRD